MINASPDGFLEGMSTTLDYKDIKILKASQMLLLM